MARSFKDGSEEEQRFESSGKITGLVSLTAAFKVEVIKVEGKIAGAGT